MKRVIKYGIAVIVYGFLLVILDFIMGIGTQDQWDDLMKRARK